MTALRISSETLSAAIREDLLRWLNWLHVGGEAKRSVQPPSRRRAA